MIKIIVTGGHLTPAYSFIEAALTQRAQVTVIGSGQNHSLETQEFAKLKVPYYSIHPVKFDRYHRLVSILKLPLIIWPVYQSCLILKRIKPDCVLVFGSFNALAVAIAAKALHIPVYLHEQTRSIGLANRLISHFAQGCAVSYPDSLSLLKCRRTLVTGNLLRRSIWQPPKETKIALASTKPILFITGGNQGSSAILNAVTPLIPKLTQTYQLVIQYGRSQSSGLTHPGVLAQKWFSVEDVAWLMSHAKCVICRGGANTLAEIMVFGTPAIVIPLPRASHDEQTRNARILTDAGAGLIIPQSSLTPSALDYALAEIDQHYVRFKAAAKTLSRHQHRDAALKLYQFVVQAP